MYFNGTKCRLFILGCFASLSLSAKDVKSLDPQHGFHKPLCFVENKGQILDQDNRSRDDIQFRMSTPGMSLFLGNGRLYYQFRNVVMGDKTPEITSYHMDVSLVGANPNAKVVPMDEIDYHENYYLSQLSNNEITVGAYAKVCYKDIYPGIDWVLYVKNDKVEYDFVVHPGANADDIKIKYDGATNLVLNAKGGILATTPMGTVEEQCPVAFETNTHKPVASKFVLNNNIVSFKTGAHKGSLTIDPFLSWARYFNNGSASPTAEDRVTDIKCAASGNNYVGGYTASNAGISLGAGVFQNTFQGGGFDAFMSKVSITGTVTWTTYFGGSGGDQANAVALGTGTSIYLVGTTTSASPTGGNTLSHLTNAGGQDIFVCKLNSTTGARTGNWSLFYGGTGNETGLAAACDATGNLFVGGSTASSGISTDATTLSGSNDGLLLKYSAAGALQWATYFGGGGTETISGISVDALNNISITGNTTSSTGVASGTAFQGTIGGGTDAFVAKYSTGGVRLWASYLGGPGVDNGYSIVTETVAPYNIYVCGGTFSTTGVASGQSYQSSNGGTQDAFLAKVDPNGTFLFWSTYYGGAGSDAAQGLVYDGLNVTMTGFTSSSSGLPTTQGYQTANAGGTDAFTAKFNPLGQHLLSSYFGSTSADQATCISIDPSTSNSIVIGGYTSSTTGINTIGTGYGGGTSDGFIAKFAPDTLVGFRQAYIDTIVCQGGTLTIHDTTNYNFRVGNTFTVQLSDASGSFATPVTIGGPIAAVSAGPITCTIPAGTPLGSGYRIRIVASAPAFISPDDYKNIQVLATLPPQTVTTNSPVCLNQTIDLFEAAPYQVTAYNWSGPSGFTSTLQSPIRTSATTLFAGIYSVSAVHNGCPVTTGTVTVTVNTLYPPAPFDSSSGPVCEGGTLHLYSRPDTAGTFTYYWTGPGGFTSTLQNPTIVNVPAAGAGTYYVIDTMAACPSVATGVVVVVTPLDTPNMVITASPNDTVCTGQMVTFTSVVTNGGYSPTFQWFSGPTTPIVGAVSDHYATSTFALGTAIRCVLYSSIACPYTTHDTSNIINMGLFNNTPLVNITATPDTFVTPNTTVTFNAAISGTSLIGYQWYVNNVAIAGATSTSLVVPHLMHNDTVSFEVTSNALCANLGVSNTLVVHVTTGVANVSPSFRNIDLFPNPNNGQFFIKGALDGINDGAMSVQVTNALGQVIYSGNSQVIGGQLDASFQLSDVPSGIYILRLNKDGEGKVFRFMVE